jgi:2-keto-4-pentenoate hydratase/2-oxohepta-3-ene-1,7-dioic acid hydratase in catechol pathway
VKVRPPWAINDSDRRAGHRSTPSARTTSGVMHSHQELLMSYQHQYIDGTHIHFPMGKVVCIGRNYAEHAKELNNPVPTEPLLFIKAGSCVVPLDDGFTLVEGKGDVHYEAEIAVLIGKPLSRTPNAEEVRDAISGFAPALDLTLRDLQATLKAKGYPWETAKSFDGACVLAPFVPGDAVEDLSDIGIRLAINGEVRQDGNSRDMLNPILPMIQHICGHFSLQPGDVILTGTPVGVGPLHKGDELVLELVGHSRFESRAL